MGCALFVVGVSETSTFLFRRNTIPCTTTTTNTTALKPAQFTSRPRRRPRNIVYCDIDSADGSDGGGDPTSFSSGSASNNNNNSNSSSGGGGIPAWKLMTIDQDVAANTTLVRLEEELDAAWYADDEARMDEIRKEIDGLQPTSYVDVLSANLKFYEAFSRGSSSDIGGCWLQDADVMCKHPLGPLFVGFWDIMSSFDMLFQQGVADVRPDNIRISVRGSTALVTCDEVVMAKVIPDEKNNIDGNDDVPTRFNPNFSAEKARIRMTAVNIFEKRNGAYYMVYHMSSPISPLTD